MNRHGGPNSSGRPADPGHLYAALMSDAGGAHPAGTFVPGGNAFSLAHYQNMPNDQVDWAALAQQWIKMRETWIQPMPALIPSPPPPPSFDREESEGRLERQQHQQHLPELDRNYEEQGEAPMEVEREEEEEEEQANDGDMPLPPNPPSISGGWPPTNDGPGWVAPSSSPWSGAPNTANTLLPVVPNAAHLPDKQPPFHPHTVPPTIVNESASAAIALWQAKNSHLFNQMQGKDGTGRPTTVPPVRRSFSSQPTKPARLPGLMDREIKMGGASSSSSSSSAVPDAGGQRQHEKESFGPGGTASINEEKRMMLPAWIREGLEKMEREKQQKLKREQERRLWAAKVESQQSRFSLSPPPSREEPTSAPLNVVEQQQQQQHRISQHQPERTEAPPKRRETVELKEEDVEKMTKKILTEIFMETTNEVLMAIAKEELGKVQKRKAKKAVTVTTNVGLATAAGGLGLGIYCDSDDDEEEEEEDGAGDGRNKKASDADNGSGNGTDHNSSDDDASDSEAMRHMMEQIRIRQQDFKVTAARIEKWLEDVSECSPHTAAELQRSVETAGSNDGSDDDGEQREGDRSADGIESDRESPVRGDSAVMSAGNNGFGNFGRPLQPYGGSSRYGDDAGGGSQEYAGRKRRDKRVSRFSDPRDTVRTTHITHVSILSAATASTGPPPKLDEPAGVPVSVSPTATTIPAAATTVATANTPTVVAASTVRSKSGKGSAPNRLTAAQRSFNSYFNIPPGQTFQTIYSISGGGSTQQQADQQHQVATSRESDGRKRSPATGGDERDSHHHRKRHHRERSHSRSSHSSRTSSWSRSPDSRSGLPSRSRSPDHPRSRRSRSGTRHSSSSHRYHRYERSSSRGRSRSPGTRSHRHRRHSKRSRSRSRSRSSSKYSSRRRF